MSQTSRSILRYRFEVNEERNSIGIVVNLNHYLSP